MNIRLLVMQTELILFLSDHGNRYALHMVQLGEQETYDPQSEFTVDADLTMRALWTSVTDLRLTDISLENGTVAVRLNHPAWNGCRIGIALYGEGNRMLRCCLAPPSGELALESLKRNDVHYVKAFLLEDSMGLPLCECLEAVTLMAKLSGMRFSASSSPAKVFSILR